MKNGTFVLDAHTGFWDASKENCKNRFGDAFIETFYAFHTGFNPPGGRWNLRCNSILSWSFRCRFLEASADSEDLTRRS